MVFENNPSDYETWSVQCQVGIQVDFTSILHSHMADHILSLQAFQWDPDMLESTGREESRCPIGDVNRNHPRHVRPSPSKWMMGRRQHLQHTEVAFPLVMSCVIHIGIQTMSCQYLRSWDLVKPSQSCISWFFCVWLESRAYVVCDMLCGSIVWFLKKHITSLWCLINTLLKHV